MLISSVCVHEIYIVWLQDVYVVRMHVRIGIFLSNHSLKVQCDCTLFFHFYFAFIPDKINLLFILVTLGYLVFYTYFRRAVISSSFYYCFRTFLFIAPIKVHNTKRVVGKIFPKIKISTHCVCFIAIQT